ncbi:MAG: hypothetical protein NTY19_08555 [Planctomycetota bacterium]|nr:hypothetical protein [Planctomycetota bacterium]
MGFTSRIPCYTIDLTKPEENRWQDVIAKEKRAVRRLARHVREKCPRWLPGICCDPVLVIRLRLRGQ